MTPTDLNLRSVKVSCYLATEAKAERLRECGIATNETEMRDQCDQWLTIQDCDLYVQYVPLLIRVQREIY